MEPSLNITDLVTVLDDRDPQAIFDEWLASMQQSDPTWVPVNGSLETVMAEAMCLGVADVIYAANRIPGVALEGMLALNDIPRYPGTGASGEVTITFDGVRTVTVAAGTRLMIDGLEFTATTTSTVTDDHIQVPVTAVTASSLGNAIPVGTGVDVLDTIPWAVAAETAGLFTGGAEPESDAAYKARCALIFPRMTTALLLPSQVTAYTASLFDVGRAATVDLWDSISGNDPGDDAGWMTVFVHGQSGSLSDTRRAEILADLSDRAGGNVRVRVDPVTVVTIDITLEVRLELGVDTGAVLAGVEAALRAAIDPAFWAWGESVTPEEIAAIVARVPGVDYATDVTAPAAAVDLAPGELPIAGTVTVTQAAP